MDSAALLNLLGNENRRRILRLLSRKPCYVTEISEYLGVSPKAVIEHLRKLEDAGLVESRTDDQRRKYFHIARKSAYPTSTNFDLTGFKYLSLDVSRETDAPLSELLEELDRLERLENELSLAQRWVQGQLCDVLDQISETVDTDEDSRIYADLLASIRAEPKNVSAISDDLDAPRDVVAELLEAMADQGLVRRTEKGWELTKKATVA